MQVMGDCVCGRCIVCPVQVLFYIGYCCVLRALVKPDIFLFVAVAEGFLLVRRRVFAKGWWGDSGERLKSWLCVLLSTAG